MPRLPLAAARLAVAAATAALAGCAADDLVAIVPPRSAAGFCQGSGPAIIVGDGITVGEADGTADDVCSGTIAKRTFRYALCTCEGWASSTPLSTDSFASSAGAYDPQAAGAEGSVGINGDLQANATLVVNGDLAAGALGGSLAQAVTVTGSVAHQGGLTGAGSLTAGQDANLQGAVALDALSVGGTLTVAAAGDLAGTDPVSYGALVVAPGALADPCACGGGDLVDVSRFVDAHFATNDNAAIGLARNALAGFTADATVDLPCGRYYLDTIDGQGAVTLRILGRVALFVGGNVQMRAPLVVELAAADAEIDLFVGGLLQSTSTVTFGSPARPARARLYIGGGGDIELSGASLLGGNVYAPEAGLAVSGDTEIFGSLFVRRLAQSGQVRIHYDRDVLSADVGCP